MTPSFAPSASRVRVQLLVPERRAIALAERLKETVPESRGPDVNGLMLVTGDVAAEELRERAARLDPGWRALLRIEPAA
jgi:hypothetical protein